MYPFLSLVFLAPDNQRLEASDRDPGTRRGGRGGGGRGGGGSGDEGRGGGRGQGARQRGGCTSPAKPQSRKTHVAGVHGHHGEGDGVCAVSVRTPPSSLVLWFAELLVLAPWPFLGSISHNVEIEMQNVLVSLRFFAGFEGLSLWFEGRVFTEGDPRVIRARAVHWVAMYRGLALLYVDYYPR